ncbi:MAG: class I SAM-dependent methyltransferase [Planctomycetales bacterium]
MLEPSESSPDGTSTIEPASVARFGELPGYAPLLAARHAAHRAELAAIVAGLPLAEGSRVLDVPCGDGFYLPLLAERAGRGGEMVGVDIAPAFLQQARRDAGSPFGPPRLLDADVYALPFADETFDFVWCAHSLISLREPVAALRELRRVTRAEGAIAVLENDGLHDVLLPWPAELELAVHDALRAAIAARHGSAGKMYAARHLQELFHEAGLETIDRRTCAVDRTAPLPEADRVFLRRYFDWLSRRVDRFLAPADRARLHALIDRGSERYLPDSPDFEMSCLDVLMLGRAAAPPSFPRRRESSPTSTPPLDARLRGHDAPSRTWKY